MFVRLPYTVFIKDNALRDELSILALTACTCGFSALLKTAAWQAKWPFP